MPVLLVQGPHSENHHPVLNTQKTAGLSSADQGVEGCTPMAPLLPPNARKYGGEGEPHWPGLLEPLLSHFSLATCFPKGRWK